MRLFYHSQLLLNDPNYNKNVSDNLSFGSYRELPPILIGNVSNDDNNDLNDQNAPEEEVSDPFTCIINMSKAFKRSVIFWNLLHNQTSQKRTLYYL